MFDFIQVFPEALRRNHVLQQRPGVPERGVQEALQEHHSHHGLRGVRQVPTVGKTPGNWPVIAAFINHILLQSITLDLIIIRKYTWE